RPAHQRGQPGGDPMKAHRTDGVSLSFAVIFLGIAAWWLVAQLLDLALPAVGWFVAGGLILLGVLGLLGALRAGRAGAAPAEATPAGAAPPTVGPTGPEEAPCGLADTAVLPTVPGSAPPFADRTDEQTSVTVPLTDPSGAGAYPTAPVSGTPVTGAPVGTPPTSAPPAGDPDDSHR
ncbi:MAG TPA: hypothetical protein VGD43_23675, partial [Micromonospora sp.]